MHTSVVGASKRVENNEIIIASEWLGKKLLGSQLSRHVGLEVKFTPGLGRKKNAYGFCYSADHSKKPREFDIELDAGLSRDNTFAALCHEMVHVKQMARGELREHIAARKTHRYWNNKLFNIEKVEYWDLPWEIEAHGRERGLFLRLMDHFDVLGI